MEREKIREELRRYVEEGVESTRSLAHRLGVDYEDVFYMMVDFKKELRDLENDNGKNYGDYESLIEKYSRELEGMY